MSGIQWPTVKLKTEVSLLSVGVSSGHLRWHSPSDMGYPFHGDPYRNAVQAHQCMETSISPPTLQGSDPLKGTVKRLAIT